jgi:hypothetical protein
MSSVTQKIAGIRRLYPNLVRALFVNGLSIGLLVFQITTQSWEKIQFQCLLSTTNRRPRHLPRFN